MPEDLTPELRERLLRDSPEFAEYLAEINQPFVELEQIARKDEEIAKLKTQLLVDRIYQQAYTQALLDWEKLEAVKQAQHRASQNHQTKIIALVSVFLLLFAIGLMV